LKDKIILALDVENLKDVKYYLKLLSGYINIFKIGPRLFIPYGKEVIKMIKDYGAKVFLDLKLHDIPTQIEKAVRGISELGIDFFTIHALGGEEMIRMAVSSAKKSRKKPKVIAVTILTSLDRNDLHYFSIENKINKLVFKLTKLALNCGVDGVVSSVAECKYLREKLGKNFLIITPGIRLGKKSYPDQKRTATAREAFNAGADYIVIGRALLKARDPVRKLEKI
jgi:orotidine-5'-phosphate decarboxylase